MGKIIGNIFLELWEVVILLIALVAFIKSTRTAKPTGFFPGYNGK